jgi:hypothetical protein
LSTDRVKFALKEQLLVNSMNDLKIKEDEYQTKFDALIVREQELNKLETQLEARLREIEIKEHAISNQEIALKTKELFLNEQNKESPSIKQRKSISTLLATHNREINRKILGDRNSLPNVKRQPR